MYRRREMLGVVEGEGFRLVCISFVQNDNTFASTSTAVRTASSLN